ncbi:MAG: hypothetical protein HY566_02495, partial [Candidatus Kerfeldbacteria bacterium]|nr:hypothetical protein [Candidatus Kerfeldbacteria bacterium]
MARLVWILILRIVPLRLTTELLGMEVVELARARRRIPFLLQLPLQTVYPVLEAGHLLLVTSLDPSIDIQGSQAEPVDKEQLLGAVEA